MRDDELSPNPEPATGPSLDRLPVAGLSRKRIAVLFAGLLALWLVGVFSRQVADVSSAAGQAEQMRQRNQAAAAEVASLERELQLIQRPAFVGEMARGYGLGSPREIPFVVDPSAPPLPANAPGSQGIAAPSPQAPTSPLEAWLEVLFGSGG